MGSGGLTPQQEAFARAVSEGKSQSDAFRQAYPRSTAWKPSSVWERASAMMADVKVASRVDALRAELAERGLWSREDSARTLIGVINNPDKASDIVAAVKALNEMHGYDAPQKIEHSGTINWPVPAPKVER